MSSNSRTRKKKAPRKRQNWKSFSKQKHRVHLCVLDLPACVGIGECFPLDQRGFLLEARAPRGNFHLLPAPAFDSENYPFEFTCLLSSIAWIVSECGHNRLFHILLWKRKQRKLFSCLRRLDWSKIIIRSPAWGFEWWEVKMIPVRHRWDIALSAEHFLAMTCSLRC